MSFRSHVLIAVCLCIGRLSYSQTERILIVEQVIESITESTEEDFDYSELSERLNFYFLNPADINSVGEEQLKEFVFLSPLHIHRILAYREKNGAFIDLLELQSIDGIDKETIMNLIPFVKIGSVNALLNTTTEDLLAKGHHDLILRYGQTLQRQQGFLIQDTSKSRYLGSPERLFVRYRYRYGQHVYLSLNMEKDAGEQFFLGKKLNGFDFYSASLYLRDLGRFKKIVIGDYALQFGQGLSLWSGLAFGKGAAIATTTKSEIGLRPYSSSNEALFFRGFATTWTVKKLNITPFVSYRLLDAGITDSADFEIKSLNQSGFHRTAGELKNKGNLRQMVYGLNVQYNKRNLSMGLSAYRTVFNRFFEPGKNIYNKFRFSGLSLFNGSIYFNRTWRNIYLFNEVSHSFGTGMALLNGLLISLSPQVSLSLLHRNYHRDYHTFYSQAISEGSGAANEKGMYSGLVIAPSRSLELAVYTDIFKFPWLKFRVDAPSTGFEGFSQLTWSLKKVLKAILRYNIEQKEQNGDEGIVSIPVAVFKQNIRAELSYVLAEGLQIRNRIEVSIHKKGSITEEGYLIYQDLLYNPMQSRFSGNFRFALFSTSGYNSRLYAYENDVLYGYSVPALQNKGIRFYLNGRWNLRRGLDVWMKYGITKYTNVDEIGSGLELISGNIKSDVKVQFRFQL